MRVCIYMCIYMCVCVCRCMCVYIYIYIYACVCVYIYMYVCVCICVCVYIYIYICMYICVLLDHADYDNKMSLILNDDTKFKKLRPVETCDHTTSIEAKFQKQLHHHHHIALVARISLTLSRHSSLLFIALGRSSGQHPVSSHSC